MPDDIRGIGASLLRKEDERHLHGRGEFVADVKLPGGVLSAAAGASADEKASPLTIRRGQA